MDKQCTVRHIAKIATFLPKWKTVANLLELEGKIISDIEDRYPNGEDQRSEALMKWVGMKGPQATYSKIYNTLCELEEMEAAEKVKELTTDERCPSLTGRVLRDPSPDPALVNSIDKLEDHFNEVVRATKKDCECVGLDKFQMIITGISTTLRGEHKPFLDKKITIISRATSVGRIFHHLNGYWDYLNYSLLEYLVKKCGSERSKQLMREFVQHIKRFMATTKMADFMPVYRKVDIPQGFKKLLTRHQLDPHQTMLLTIEEFLKEFCRHYSMHKFWLIIEKVQDGSIEIVWLIPSSVVEQLRTDLMIPEVGDKVMKRMKQYRLVEILIDGEVVFSTTSAKNNDGDKMREESEDSLSSCTSCPCAPLSLDSEPSLSDLMDRVVSIPEQHSSTTGVHLHAVSPGVSPVTGDPSDEYTLIESDATIEQSSTSTSTSLNMDYKHINYIQASIIGALLLERLINKDNTVNTLIWAGIIVNSLMTSFIYITLLKKTWLIILQHMTIWRAIVTVFLFIGGLMSSGTLLLIIFQAYVVVMETDLEHQWNVLFYIAVIARSIHCILGVVFFSLVAPVSNFWAANLNDGIPRRLLALMLPSKILLFFHWNVLIPTFSSTVDNYVIHAASFIYRTVDLVWIVLLTIYIIWRAANNVPNMVANEEHGENEVPVQDAVPNMVANEEHGENEVPVQDAVPNVVANEEQGYKMSVEEIEHSSGGDKLVIIDITNVAIQHNI